MPIIQFFCVILIVTLTIYTYGTFLTLKIINDNILYKVSLSTIFGGIVISLIILIINFFSPFNKFIGNTFLFVSIIYFLIIFLKEKKKIKLIKSILIIASISSLLLLYENINRPDAGLYHIPYIQIIHENKILLGISNIHFRFGHVSIIQYLSAAYNNSFMPIETLSVPLSVMMSSFYLLLISYLYKNKNFKQKDFFIFLITIYTFYSFNRFSAFGNDSLSHMFFFLFLIKIFDLNLNNIDAENLGNLSIISTFAFLQKTFMIFLLVIVFYFYLKSNVKKFKFLVNYKFLISFIFLSLWFLKNIFITGCILYPISNSCFTSFVQTDIETTQQVAENSEAWAKDWSNSDNSVKIVDYNKNFNWIYTWSNNHLIKIIKKLFPYILLFLIFYLFCLYNFKNQKNRIEISRNIHFITLICLFLSLVWLLKFPLYRYGQSFLSGFLICLIFLLFAKTIKLEKIKKNVSFFLVITILLVTSKNILRIYDNYDYKNIWPNIYTLSELKVDNYKKDLNSINKDNKFIYFYSNGDECLYNKSPCSNYKFNNISKKKNMGMKIFFKTKN